MQRNGMAAQEMKKVHELRRSVYEIASGIKKKSIVITEDDYLSRVISRAVWGTVGFVMGLFWPASSTLQPSNLVLDIEDQIYLDEVTRDLWFGSSNITKMELQSRIELLVYIACKYNLPVELNALLGLKNTQLKVQDVGNASIQKILTSWVEEKQNKLTVKYSSIHKISESINNQINKKNNKNRRSINSEEAYKIHHLSRSNLISHEDVNFFLEFLAKIACEFGLKNDLKQLLNIDKSIFNSILPLLFRLAAYHGQYEVLVYLHKLKPTMINSAETQSKCTTLHQAIKGMQSTQSRGDEHKPIIEYLIGSGADIVARNSYQQAPLDLIDKNDWFLIRVIAWHMKWRIRKKYYHQEPDPVIHRLENHIGIINRGLAEQDVSYICSKACELGMLSALHYLLESNVSLKRPQFNSEYYAYISLGSSQPELLLYFRQVRGYSSKRYGISPLPQISYDDFCRERLSRQFILRGDIPPAFDNFLQLYSLLESMSDKQWKTLELKCTQSVAMRPRENQSQYIIGFKGILAMLATSTVVYFTTEDWLYTLSGMLFSGLSAAYLNRMPEHSQLLSTVDFVARENRKNYLLMYRTKSQATCQNNVDQHKLVTGNFQNHL